MSIAVLISCKNKLKFSLSAAEPPCPAYPGYSQSISIPSNLNESIKFTHSCAKVARFVASAAIAGKLFDKVQPPIDGNTFTPLL